MSKVFSTRKIAISVMIQKCVSMCGTLLNLNIFIIKTYNPRAWVQLSSKFWSVITIFGWCDQFIRSCNLEKLNQCAQRDNFRISTLDNFWFISTNVQSVVSFQYSIFYFIQCTMLKCPIQSFALLTSYGHSFPKCIGLYRKCAGIYGILVKSC